jgi:hypothetical protein
MPEVSIFWVDGVIDTRSTPWATLSYYCKVVIGGKHIHTVFDVQNRSVTVSPGYWPHYSIYSTSRSVGLTKAHHAGEQSHN